MAFSTCTFKGIQSQAFTTYLNKSNQTLNNNVNNASETPDSISLLPSGSDTFESQQNNNQVKSEANTDTAKINPNESSTKMFQQTPQQPETVKETLLKSAISLASFGIMIFAMMKFLPKIMNECFSNLPGFSKASENSIALWEDISGASKIQDMALPESLKSMLEKIKNSIENPEGLIKRGGKTTNSILLYGPPGTGKTTFAKALAREFQGAMFASLDITKLNSKYYGETEKRINKAIDSICEAARKNPQKKIFVFVDEIDSVMMADSGPNAKLSNDVLNEFKKCFTEKFGKYSNIITIGATNLPIDIEAGVAKGGKSLDRAMLDRFEQKILVDLPTSEQLIEALTTHYKKCPLVDDTLKSEADERLKRLCEFLAKKEHSVSFRTLNSIYNDTAARFSGDEKKVKFEDIIETIESKKKELNIKERDWADLMAEFNIPYTIKKDTNGSIPIGFRA